MTKTIYNLSDISELVQFMNDCISAINECPNWETTHSWGRSLELEAIKGEITAIDIYDRFSKKECPLNSSGYYSSLSKKSKNTFDYVYEYGRYGLKRLCNDGVVYKKHGWRFS